MDAPRKASDVLLDLESKVALLLKIISAQDTNIKVLSNKVNDLFALINSLSAGASPHIEAVDTIKQIPISIEDKLPIDNSPSGFRRTSRPETYSAENASVVRQDATKPPPGRESEVIVPAEAIKKAQVIQQIPVHKNQARAITQNAVPVQQRIVDKSGKSVFLADVEISNGDTGAQVFKTRTNGTGKWMASLSVGKYRVVIKKSESLTKERVEIAQDIFIDGSASPLELKTMIIK